MSKLKHFFGAYGRSPNSYYATVSSIPSDIDGKVKNRSQFIESLLQWRKKQQQQEMVEACMLLDEMNLEWDNAWQQAGITDWEASG